MIGSAFIIHENGWACSNEVVLDFYSKLIDNNDPTKGIVKTQTLTVRGLFNGLGALGAGQKVELVVVPDDENKSFGFVGEVRSSMESSTIINIFSKTDRIKEILSNITFKKLED